MGSHRAQSKLANLDMGKENGLKLVVHCVGRKEFTGAEMAAPGIIDNNVEMASLMERVVEAFT